MNKDQYIEGIKRVGEVALLSIEGCTELTRIALVTSDGPQLGLSRIFDRFGNEVSDLGEYHEMKSGSLPTNGQRKI